MDSVELVLKWVGNYLHKQRPEVVLLFVCVVFVGYMAIMAVPRVEAIFSHTEEQQTAQIARICEAFEAVHEQQREMIQHLIDKRVGDSAE